jgi:hypothetical protein
LTDLAPRVGDHPPGEAGYLLGSEAGLDREQEDDTVPRRPAGLGQVARDGFDLLNVFACLPNDIDSSKPIIYGLQDAGL